MYWRTSQVQHAFLDRHNGEFQSFAALPSSPPGKWLESLNAVEPTANEKRMLVILPEDSYASWLSADASQSGHFLRHYPADLLQASVPTIERGLF